MDYQPVIGKIVATRNLDFVRHSGESETAIVSVGEPVRPEGGPWYCPYQVQTKSFERTFAMAGDDSMQALILTLHIIATELNALAKQHGGVFKQYGGADLGFPSMRSLDHG
jgi:hypothetical protein